MPRGKLVVIEGGDATGKKTQCDLLVSELEKREVKVVQVSFPRYETFFGKLVKEALSGSLGDFRNLHPKLASLPYMMDRMTAHCEVETLLESHDLVLFNRYVESNAAYGMAKLVVEEEIQEFLLWLLQAEYEVLGEFIHKPDLVILLDTTPAASGGLVWNRGGPSDQYERDREFQKSVIWCYKALADQFPDYWRVVQCDIGGTRMRTPESIHVDVLRLVLWLLAR